MRLNTHFTAKATCFDSGTRGQGGKSGRVLSGVEASMGGGCKLDLKVGAQCTGKTGER